MMDISTDPNATLRQDAEATDLMRLNVGRELFVVERNPRGRIESDRHGKKQLYFFWFFWKGRTL